MEHRRPGPDEAPTGRRPNQAPQAPLHHRRPAALWPGQMVSRRIPAALGLCGLLAQGRPAALGQRRIVRRWKPKTTATAKSRPRCSSKLWPAALAAAPNGSCPPSRMHGIICGKSAACPSTRTRSNPISRIRKTARAWPKSSSRAWTKSLVTCCPCNAPRPASRPAGSADRGFCGPNDAI